MTTDQSSVPAASVLLPGRLGNASMSLRDDPRADPRMVAELAKYGLAELAAPAPLSADAPREHLLAFASAAEEQFEGLFTALLAGLAPVAGVTSETLTITGTDGNEIKLYVHAPAEAPVDPLPCVVHFHGGGMVVLEAAGVAYRYLRDRLAATGMIVVGVEFRNGGGKLGSHPFPAGLTDCADATRWTLDHADELGVRNVIVCGESGGGNLALAVALKAGREGWADRLAGVYAMCPFISNQWGERPAELVSMHENDGYFLGCDLMALLASVYDPGGANAKDGICWPHEASDDDLAGLPPHVISVNELDPLRDEGLTYLRRLLGNGVSAVGRTVAGTCHGGDVLFPGTMPDVFAATIRDVKGFADSV